MNASIENIKNTQYTQETYKSGKERVGNFSELIQLPGRDMSGKRAPYDELAENGEIIYNGVVFRCDYEHNQLHLGDTTDKNKCLNIPLSGGGCLVVNRGNLDGLKDAIGMFSAEDQYLILRALSMEKKIQELRGEIEEADSVMIGASSYTDKEWNQVLDRFDEQEEKMKEEAEAAKEDSENDSEKIASKSDIHIAYEKLRKQRLKSSAL